MKLVITTKLNPLFKRIEVATNKSQIKVNQTLILIDCNPPPFSIDLHQRNK